MSWVRDSIFFLLVALVLVRPVFADGPSQPSDTGAGYLIVTPFTPRPSLKFTTDWIDEGLTDPEVWIFNDRDEINFILSLIREPQSHVQELENLYRPGIQNEQIPLLNRMSHFVDKKAGYLVVPSELKTSLDPQTHQAIYAIQEEKYNRFFFTS